MDGDIRVVVDDFNELADGTVIGFLALEVLDRRLHRLLV